jgi:hypothetical protein
MIVDNSLFQEEQVQSFQVKESTLLLEKGKWPNHPSTYALIKNTIN